MESVLESALRRDLWQHLTSDRQAWLLGAGVSVGAGIPLMYPLTDYVQTLIAEEHPDKLGLLVAIRDQLPEDCHIEHILSQLGDLIAVAQRSRTASIAIGGENFNAETLRSVHNTLLLKVGYAVKYGYIPANNGQLEDRGRPERPIVKVDDHRAFVRQLFASRAKPGFLQAPISFFTTNYDTLIEDALALERVPFLDGFLGGAMAYWSPDVGYADEKRSSRAKVVKLHGSVDWHLAEDGAVIRCRDGCCYPGRENNLLIYPQSTKYVATQKDPFAALFAMFRTTLATAPDNVLGICGYSFSDDHINGEIEAAMSLPTSKTVIVAFSEERSIGGSVQLPLRLQSWLSEQPWRERVLVASSKGLYHGSLNNLYSGGDPINWWTIQGLTAYLGDGPEMLPPIADETVLLGAGDSSQEVSE